MLDVTAQHSEVVLDDGTKVTWRVNPDWKATNRKTRIYVSATEDFNVVEDLENRLRRPYLLWKPRVLEVLHQLGIDGLRLRWSQNAGCTCACSPGFIVEGHMAQSARAYTFARGGDVWITLTNAPAVDDNIPARQL
jgi:hypothetical protein